MTKGDSVRIKESGEIGELVEIDERSDHVIYWVRIPGHPFDPDEPGSTTSKSPALDRHAFRSDQIEPAP